MAKIAIKIAIYGEVKMSSYDQLIWRCLVSYLDY